MSLYTPILTGRASLVTRWIIYGVILLILGFIIWSAFFKHTNQQHTTVEAGGKAIYILQGADVNIGMFSCVSLEAEKYKKDKK